MAPQDPFTEVEQAIAQAETGSVALTGALQAGHARERARTRAHVTKVVIWSYVLALGAVVAYLIGDSLASAKDRFPDIIELVKVAALPIVSFVVGHYFGSAADQG